MTTMYFYANDGVIATKVNLFETILTRHYVEAMLESAHGGLSSATHQDTRLAVNVAGSHNLLRTPVGR